MPGDNVSKKRGSAKMKISKKREAAMQRVVDEDMAQFKHSFKNSLEKIN